MNREQSAALDSPTCGGHALGSQCQEQKRSANQEKNQ